MTELGLEVDSQASEPLPGCLRWGLWAGLGVGPKIQKIEKIQKSKTLKIEPFRFRRPNIEPFRSRRPNWTLQSEKYKAMKIEPFRSRWPNIEPFRSRWPNWTLNWTVRLQSRALEEFAEGSGPVWGEAPKSKKSKKSKNPKPWKLNHLGPGDQILNHLGPGDRIGHYRVKTKNQENWNV